MDRITWGTSRAAVPAWLLLSLAFSAACINDLPEGATASRDRVSPSAAKFVEPAQDASCDAAFDYITPPDAAPTGPMIEMAIDDAQIYFITLDHLYSVPREGGRPERLFTRNRDSATTLSALWMREDDLLVYQDAQNVFVVPKSGGAAKRLPAWKRMRDGALAARDGRIAVGWSSAVSSDGYVERELWQLDAQTVRFSTMGRTPGTVSDEVGALGGGSFFWTDHLDGGVNTLVFSMPVSGGEATEVVLSPERDRRLTLFGAAAGQLYMFGTDGDSDLQLLRVPATGGEVQQLGDAGAYAEFASLMQFAPTDAGVLLSLYENRPGGRVQRDWVAHGADNVERLPCIAAREAPAFAIAAGALYGAVYAPEGGVAIVRRPLPEQEGGML